MKLYKLIKQDWTTYNGSMEWEIGKTNKVKKCKNPQLCTSDIIHAYKNLNLGLLSMLLLISYLFFRSKANVAINIYYQNES